MNTQEIWKPIAECNGEYIVSTHGRVKSLKFGKERILKPNLNTQGYPIVGICLNGKLISRTIHKLVALSFIPNTENKPQVNHKNGIKTDNNVANLEWVTRSENVKHAWDNGLFEDKRRAISISAKLHHSKPVKDLYTDIIYDSLSEACRILDLKYSTHAMQIWKQYTTQRFEYIKL